MSKTYAIKEIFGPTIQGEGYLAGTPCYFIRFAGCNMWDGRIETRAASNCPYCDTDFFKGDKLTASDIVNKLKSLSFDTKDISWIIITGGEPLLQLDEALVNSLHNEGYRVQVETNGTINPDEDLMWEIDSISMSPKVSLSEIKLKECNSLKILFPHPNPNITPEAFAEYPADDYYIQPVDVFDFGEGYTIERYQEESRENLDIAIKKVQQLGDPWKLGMQLHKVIGVR